MSLGTPSRAYEIVVIMMIISMQFNDADACRRAAPTSEIENKSEILRGTKPSIRDGYIFIVQVYIHFLCMVYGKQVRARSDAIISLYISTFPSLNPSPFFVF